CRDREREGGSEIEPSPFGHNELRREEQTAGERGDGDELEEPATRVTRIRQARRVERVDPAEEVRDLQPDEEHKERVDGEERRRTGCRAEEAAKARQDRGHRSLGAASRDEE